MNPSTGSGQAQGNPDSDKPRVFDKSGLAEFYEQTPVERHSEIVISGDRLFFDGEEYALSGERELRLIRSSKGLAQALQQIHVKLGIIK